MILTGDEIKKRVALNQIIIDPFDEKCITTNSYDFHLGDTILINKDEIIDPKLPSKFDKVSVTSEGYVLRPDRLYLGHTQETIGSNYYVPIIRGKSSTGRLGIYIHITADLIDIGSINQYTLMLHAVQPVKVYPGMLIGQVTFWRCEGKIDLYRGKYKGKNGPQPSQIYKDLA